MIHAAVDLIGIGHDAMTGHALDVSNKADTAGVVFLIGIVKTARGG